MTKNKKRLVFLILVAVIVVSVVAIVVNKLVNLPQPITEDDFYLAYEEGLYAQVYLKKNKVTAVDKEGNKYSFTVEHPLDFYDRVTDYKEIYDEIETELYLDIDPNAPEEE